VHAVGSYLRDPPPSGPQEDRLPDATLVDELLVEFPQANPALFQDDRVLAGIGDRAPIYDRQVSASRKWVETVVHAIP
jgi:hypothetical protein